MRVFEQNIVSLTKFFRKRTLFEASFFIKIVKRIAIIYPLFSFFTGKGDAQGTSSFEQLLRLNLANQLFSLSRLLCSDTLVEDAMRTVNLDSIYSDAYASKLFLIRYGISLW